MYLERVKNVEKPKFLERASAIKKPMPCERAKVHEKTIITERAVRRTPKKVRHFHHDDFDEVL
jgi:hypothetical protein